MADHSEKALAVVREKGLAHFEKCTADELRELLGSVNDEMRDLQEKMKQLKTQRQILEMLLYVMYPEEAKQDSGLGHYHGAAHMIAIRLSQIRGDRGAAKEHEVCSVEGCKLDVRAKGFCKFHYDEEQRDKRSAPLKDGATLQPTAKRGSEEQKARREERDRRRDEALEDLEAEEEFEVVNDDKAPEPVDCHYCGKKFADEDFLDQHRTRCSRNPDNL